MSAGEIDDHISQEEILLWQLSTILNLKFPAELLMGLTYRKSMITNLTFS